MGGYGNGHGSGRDHGGTYTCKWASSWRRDLAHLLAGLDVYLIGMHCVVEEIDRRERARGHRRIGVARTHITFGRIHSLRALRPGGDHDGGHRFRSVASLRG